MRLDIQDFYQQRNCVAALFDGLEKLRMLKEKMTVG